MRVCVPTNSPGGPDVPVASSFHESDFFDFYELNGDGRFNLFVQIRNCAGTCKDDVETVVRRGADAIIVNNLSANSLHRFTRAGVAVYKALDGPSKYSLESLNRKDLGRIDRIKG
jgi:predicted Fe-Mo cluster-binding NifX family protein